MVAFIVKLIISLAVPSVLFGAMGSSDPTYNIFENPTFELVLMFMLVGLIMYFASTMVLVFVRKTDNVIIGLILGVLISSLIWLAVCVGMKLIFGALGMGDEMFTNDHSDNQRLVVMILDGLLCIPFVIDVVVTIRRVIRRRNEM